MATPIIMPRFGMTQEEATIVRWIAREGDRVEQGDPLCEVTTDKVNMEVEAPADGVLAGLRYSEGDTVPVTEVIAYLLAEGETLTAVAEEVPAKAALPDTVLAAAPVTTPGPADVLTPTVKATPVARRMAAAERVELGAIPGSGPEGLITRDDVAEYLAKKSREVPGKRRATPAARRLARQGGISLSQVKGSGPRGRVQGWDVSAALELPVSEGVEEVPPAEVPAFAWDQPKALKLEGMRRTIAERMQSSWQTIPHITITVEIDMSRASAMREAFNSRAAGAGPGISMTAVLVKACAAALRQHPLLNSYFRKDEILLMPEVNIGVAVALEEGLIVPVVRQADARNLPDIADAVHDLSRRAREGRLRPEDVIDGTFTLSNLGMFGVDRFTAIINPPQVAILATGRIAKRYVMDEIEGPVWRPMMSATLSVDHRVVDGAYAARFLTTLRGILETAGAQWG
jgi:pyruvate dehydrogenase E2 component (dihydrolipoamide acetyltransferase)